MKRSEINQYIREAKVPLHVAAMGGLDSGRLEKQRTGM